ncbi:MAG: YbhB/YbcL family Raf kinase inhibitor-like protein [Nitrospirae bacterium]|nr:YbhB/YbcL family Raf kinase inhibitor-like protein [Nitrospirota bacterium]
MKKRFIYFSLMLSLLLLISNVMGKEVTKMTGLKISSPVFENNGYIPQKYTCDGMDINPPLLIENVSEKAKSLALIIDDPDAPVGIWVHWVLWNIDPKTKDIKEDSVPKGASQGLNDFRKHDYGGPCPPSGTHRYFFKLYALDTTLNLSSNAKKADLEKAMKGHIIEQTQIIGLYKRR